MSDDESTLTPGARAALAALRQEVHRAAPSSQARRRRQPGPPRKVVVELTPSQLRCVNAALAYYETEMDADPAYADPAYDGHAYRQVVRTRDVVHQAMSDNRVEY